MTDEESRSDKGVFGLIFVPVSVTDLLVVWITATVNPTALKTLWSARSGEKLAEHYPTIYTAVMVCLMAQGQGFVLTKDEVRRWMTWLVKS